MFWIDHWHWSRAERGRFRLTRTGVTGLAYHRARKSGARSLCLVRNVRLRQHKRSAWNHYDTLVGTATGALRQLAIGFASNVASDNREISRFKLENIRASPKRRRLLAGLMGIRAKPALKHLPPSYPSESLSTGPEWKPHPFDGVLHLSDAILPYSAKLSVLDACFIRVI